MTEYSQEALSDIAIEVLLEACLSGAFNGAPVVVSSVFTYGPNMTQILPQVKLIPSFCYQQKGTLQKISASLFNNVISFIRFISFIFCSLFLDTMNGSDSAFGEFKM